MQPPPIQAVLFDFGIVLTGPPDPAVWARMYTLTQLEPAVFKPAYWAPRLAYDRGDLTGAAYWQAVARHGGRTLDADTVDRLLQADVALWTAGNRPMIDWAMRLRAGGVRTGVLSNLGDSLTAGVLAAWPWLAGFDHHVWSYAHGLAKPEPAIYGYAIDGLGVPPGQILFVDDRVDNIAGGVRAGLETILYGDHAEFVAELEARGLGELWRTGQTTPATVVA